MSRMALLVAAVSALAGLAGCDGGSGPGVAVEVVAGDLDNPLAVLVNADGSFVVAESGAGRLVTITSNGPVAPLVTGFEVGSYTPYAIGPLSLLRASDGGLIVGEGGLPPGQDRISFYAADGTPAFAPLVPVGGGDYYGLALRPDTGDLLMASASTDRLFGAPPAAGGGYGPPVEIIHDTQAAPIGAAAPTALAFGPDGLLYMGFAGAGAAKIVRIDMATSYVETVATADSPVTGIAFRPSDARLFYAVFGTSERAGGAIRDIDSNGASAQFAGALAGPTALAFDSADTLYVTVIGVPPNGSNGQLLKITEIVDVGTNGASNTNGL
jgi:glucose/arabinose dehydrogenase